MFGAGMLTVWEERKRNTSANTLEGVYTDLCNSLTKVKKKKILLVRIYFD